MEFTALQIATLLSGKVEGDPEVKVSNIAKIEEGAPGMLSFLSNPKYTPYIYTTRSSIVLVNESFQPSEPISATLIRVPDAYAAFAQLLSIYQQYVGNKMGVSSLSFVSEDAKYGEDVYIGEFAFVGRRAKIGDRVKIYPQVYVGDDVVVGDDTVLYPGVKLYANTMIGKNCIIHAGVVLGADGFGFVPQPDRTYKKLPQIGNVVVADDVEIGANTTIDCATMGSTRIGKGVKLDNLIQVAHNVEIGENTAMAAQSGISGSTKVGRNCIIAGQVGIVGHINIADNTSIAAQSGVLGSIKEGGRKYMGSPAYQYHDYMRDVVRQRKLESLEKRVAELESLLKDK